MQTIIVVAIVLTAATVLGTRVWRALRRAKNKGQGCGKGCKCG